MFSSTKKKKLTYLRARASSSTMLRSFNFTSSSPSSLASTYLRVIRNNISCLFKIIRNDIMKIIGNNIIEISRNNIIKTIRNDITRIIRNNIKIVGKIEYLY
jgi:hypothetical protein